MNSCPGSSNGESARVAECHQRETETNYKVGGHKINILNEMFVIFDASTKHRTRAKMTVVELKDQMRRNEAGADVVAEANLFSHIIL